MQPSINQKSSVTPILGSLYQFNINSNQTVIDTYLNTQYYYYNLYNSLYNQLPFINDVQRYTYNESIKRVDITTITDINDDNIDTEIDTQLPLFFINKNLIKIPSKVYYTLSRYTPRSLLYDIHKDAEVAIELCLLFTTQLTSTYFEMKDENKSDGWKSLMAKYLRDLVFINQSTYHKVVKALEYPLSKGKILECDHKYIKGEKSFNYRLGKDYVGCGIVSYELKTKVAQTLLNKHCFRKLASSNQNIICKNLIRMYSDIELPTIEQITKEAERLIKKKYVTKKGKRLTFLNKHSKNYYKNANERSFVEDAIEIFQYLTDNGLMIPDVGGEKSGGRVVDTFTLMPSWIRRLVKYKGKRLIECDYSALHPNIAINLYGGKTEFIVHGDLATYLKLDVMEVKQEHLSFFNKNVFLMKQSPLYNYYAKYEPIMLENIIREKYSSEFKHKITSRKMFGAEVLVMTEVVSQLNNEGIYVLYVYDALLCSKKNAGRVADVMDSVILKHGIKTKAKLSGFNKYNPLIAKLKESKIDPSFLIPIHSKPEMTKEKTDEVENKFVVNFDELNFNLRLKASLLQRINAGENLQFIDALVKFSDGGTITDKVLKVDDPINYNLKYVAQSHISLP